VADDARVRLLDELAANATAAPVVRLLDGWLLRCAPDLPFRRSNCALAIGGASALTARELDARLTDVEQFYARWNLPARVQITPASRPIGLDAALAARGYSVEAPVDVLAGDVRVVLAATDAPRDPHEREPETTVAESVRDEWIDEYAATHGDGNAGRRRVAAYGRLLRDLALDTVAVAASRDGRVVGIGFGVFERQWLGIFGMGTRAEHRRRGVATAVVRALAGAAAARGVRHSYLQVELDNPGARTLYEQVGFRAAYSYHYRRGEA
jgi:ribosomal protein S18 acetylase RimI-like enzyme